MSKNSRGATATAGKGSRWPAVSERLSNLPVGAQGRLRKRSGKPADIQAALCWRSGTSRAGRKPHTMARLGVDARPPIHEGSDELL